MQPVALQPVAMQPVVMQAVVAAQPVPTPPRTDYDWDFGVCSCLDDCGICKSGQLSMVL